jgi:hypothetical protein
MILRSFLMVCNTICFAVVSPAQQAPVKTRPAVSAPSRIHQLFLEDQADRSGGKISDGANVNQRDAARRAEVKKLLAAGEVRTAGDFHDAAYIYQHGIEASDYLLAHILAVEAVVKGDDSSKWISAATLDRYLQAIGQPQVFGTQYLDKRVAYFQAHKNEPQVPQPDPNVHGTTQEPFDRTLMPNALRHSFCVPGLEQQALNLKEFEAGGYPDGIIPKGCTR